jgi:hypothetical protein
VRAEEKFDWNRVIGPCNIGLLICAAIPTVFMVWDRTHPTGQPGQPVVTQGATVSGQWAFPVVVGAMLLGIVLNLVAAIISRRSSPQPPPSRPVEPEVSHDECNKAIKRSQDAALIESEGRKRAEKEVEELKASLIECRSFRDHWQKEVDRVKRESEEQIRLRENQVSENGRRVSELEQQLRSSQNTVDGLSEQLSVPNGRFKLKRVRYVATESRSLELRDFGKLPERDLTEFFEDKYLENGKLVIPPGLYRKLFGPLNDPALGVPKVLEIRFVHAGNEMSVLLPENISITLPFPYEVTPEHVT